MVLPSETALRLPKDCDSSGATVGVAVALNEDILPLVVVVPEDDRPPDDDLPFVGAGEVEIERVPLENGAVVTIVAGELLLAVTLFEMVNVVKETADESE
jgi:hypothetical protein